MAVSDDENPQEPCPRRCPHHGPQTLDTCPLCGEPTTLAVPCCARLSTVPVSWCTLDDGHDGPCAGPHVRELEVNEFGPADSQRRRW